MSKTSRAMRGFLAGERREGQCREGLWFGNHPGSKKAEGRESTGPFKVPDDPRPNSVTRNEGFKSSSWQAPFWRLASWQQPSWRLASLLVRLFS